MTRWKRRGLMIVKFAHDHPPSHVHVFKDAKQLCRFDIVNWRLMDGKMLPGLMNTLEKLKKEGVFDELD